MDFYDCIYSKIDWIGGFSIAESSCPTTTVKHFGSFKLRLIWSYQPILRICCPIEGENNNNIYIPEKKQKNKYPCWTKYKISTSQKYFVSVMTTNTT